MPPTIEQRVEKLEGDTQGHELALVSLRRMVIALEKDLRDYKRERQEEAARQAQAEENAKRKQRRRRL